MGKYKVLFVAAWITALCCIIVGCGKEQEGKVTLTMIHAWGGIEADHEAMRDIYKGFEERNPDVELRLISMPTRDEMIRKVEDMLMVGDIPDIVAFGGMGYNKTYDFMVKNDVALDITPYLKEDDEFASSISKANLEYWETEDERLYAVADVLSLSGGYWYNEDILEQAGITELPGTWADFLSMCEALNKWAESTDAGVKAFQFSTEGYLYFMDHILADNGGNSEKSIREHRMIINDREFLNALEQLKGLYAYTSANDKNYTYRDETSLFNNGKLALYINGVWGSLMISDDINAKYALLPNASGTLMACESACMGYVLGKSSNAEREKAAVRFLKYMLSEEVQVRILQDTEQIPANPKVSLENCMAHQDRLYQAAELVLNADIKIDVPENLWDVNQKECFTENIIEVIEGKMPEQELIEKLR